MAIVPLNKEECQNATRLAIRHMSRVAGVIKVNLIEDFSEIEARQTGGFAYAFAPINQIFIDNCVNKQSPKFFKGQRLYDDYHKFYGLHDKEQDLQTDRQWIIGIQKHKSFFSVKYSAISNLNLGLHNYRIGFKEGVSTLEEVFENLCYSIQKVSLD
jgi:hypothetical protein